MNQQLLTLQVNGMNSKKNNKLDIRIIDLNSSLVLDNRDWTGLIKSRLIYIYIFL